MSIKIEEIYQSTWEHYQKAKKNVAKRMILEHSADAISNVIPGFDAEKLDFGSYDKENYAVLFVDMRNSTLRAKQVGAEKTFLTMHVFLPALLEVVKYYHGKVIDIMGDGIMVFWGGTQARESENMTNALAVKNAGLCGRDMLKICKKVINEIIIKEKLGPAVNIGIGVTFDSVIVTKVGIASFFDVKAFGDCINDASKYSSKVCNKVKVSKKVKNLWPKSPNGNIHFTPIHGENAYYLE